MLTWGALSSYVAQVKNSRAPERPKNGHFKRKRTQAQGRAQQFFDGFKSRFSKEGRETAQGMT
jgi:hypothetical protein